MTNKDFAKEVEALALTITGYQTGKSGQNGLCDCIGLIMGVMHKAYPVHSTNYFARYEMQTLLEISQGYSPRVGDVLYKAREDNAQLNERYLFGGRYYTGDLLDYYHVGVVTDTRPLEITHCTQSSSVNGIKRDSALKGWTHCGTLRGIEFATDTNVGSTEDGKLMKTAYVSADNGLPVRMRKSPNPDAATIDKVPVGTVVDLVEQGTRDGVEWATIIDPDGRRGYMMAQFLKVLEHADEEPNHTGDVSQNQSSGETFEETVIQRLDRLETLLNAILDAQGVAG